MAARRIKACFQAMTFLILPGASLFLSGMSNVSAEPITVKDDLGNTITLNKPAKRIISLAPHNTELLFAAGAGKKVVATVDYSDYPAEAKKIRRIGNHNSVNMELVFQLKPHLIVAWDSGNPKQAVNKLKSMGFTVFLSEPRSLMDIQNSIVQLGKLAGTYSTASMTAEKFVDRYYELKTQYDKRQPITVFYEIWNEPMMTVNDSHIINEIIEFCGGKNIFAGIKALTPTVGIEPVIAAKPQVIIASAIDGKPPKWLYDWKKWRTMPAVRNNNLYFIKADHINRSSPRILDGLQRMCEILDEARAKNKPGTTKK